MKWVDGEILAEKQILLTGRRDEERDPLRLFWVGSGAVMTVKAEGLSAVIEADWSGQAPWMSVALDGAPVSRFPLRRGTHTYALLTAMDPSAAHRVSLTRDTQPMENDETMVVRLHCLELDGELLEQGPRRRIEFIGDSLTSGEGLAGPMSAEEWKTVYMSGALTYAARTCALLDADGEWVSQSGWGIVTDWTNDRSHTLPSIYGRVCALHAAGRIPYDFAAHPVDAVVVNLGTNDTSALNSLPEAERSAREEEIAAGVRSFIAQIRAARPEAPILWVYGMCGGGLDSLLGRVVQDAAAVMGDDRITFCPLPACGPDEQGSLGHPGYLSHRRCAAVIAERLQAMLK